MTRCARGIRGRRREHGRGCVIAEPAGDDLSRRQPCLHAGRRAYFPTIDSLATLEGGGSPLHAALAGLIGFTASAAPPGSRRAVVALASGDVSDCGDLADCGAAQDALLEQSVAASVAVVVVGLSDPTEQADREPGPLCTG